MTTHAMQNTPNNSGFWGHLLDVKVLTAAGGLILAAFTMYLYSGAIKEGFSGITSVQSKQNDTIISFTKAVEANTQVMQQFINSKAR